MTQTFSIVDNGVVRPMTDEEIELHSGLEEPEDDEFQGGVE
jgi:hypothetical protein